MIKIARIGNNDTVAFAVQELYKYLSVMDKTDEVCIMLYNGYNADCKDVIWVGRCDEFKTPDVSNNDLDDAISINIENGCGYISGNNDRAVLLAVYRFLRELGCCFLRPGADGEVIPSALLAESDVSVFESASYRHRAVCIEGAVSYTDIREFIDWLPKVGLNGFYNQFRVPFVFYDRWYLHKYNESEFKPYQLSVSEAEGFMNESISEIKKRGLLYHAVGHGWTCEPFGIKALGWYQLDDVITEDVKSNFAMVDGKRDLWRGVPMNTNLCYSSEKVRNIMSDAVVEYSTDHPEVDYIHFWLSDGSNNHCECDECKKALPSDFYVKLLNDIDAKLTAKGLDTKIVFLIYVDLLWAPIKEKLNNPDRFVLMFAPITRTYSSNMADCGEFVGELPSYSRNNNKIPSSLAENIAHLKNWQNQSDCDSFDFDYHYMWDHFKDIGNFKTARVLFEDIQSLEKIGLNGLVSCQCIRSFFPHGLGMNGMAEALWDKSKNFDDVSDKYFMSAYGKHGKEVAAYFVKLSELSDPVFVRAEYDKTVNPDLVKQFEECKKLVDKFAEFIDGIKEYENDVVALSYEYLSYQVKFAKLYLDWEIALASGQKDLAETALETVIDFAAKTEKQLHRVFDFYVFRNTIKRKMHDKLIEKI